MSNPEEIGDLIAECLNRCRESGYSLTTLIRFLDELRADGASEVDVQQVDLVMRHIILDLRGTDKPG